VLELRGKIRLAILALYQTDRRVNAFLDCFNRELQHPEVVVAEERSATIGAAMSFMSDLPEKQSYNAVMFVTHGTSPDGQPTNEESAKDPRPLDAIIER